MCVSLSLSLSVCLSVCLVLPDDDAHGADGEPMYEASIYHPVSCIYVRMCVCVCVRAAPLIPKPQSAFSVSRSESPLD